MSGRKKGGKGTERQEGGKKVGLKGGNNTIKRKRNSDDRNATSIMTKKIWGLPFARGNNFDDNLTAIKKSGGRRGNRKKKTEGAIAERTETTHPKNFEKLQTSSNPSNLQPSGHPPGGRILPT